MQQKSIFDQEPQPVVALENGLKYYPEFLSKQIADTLFDRLLSSVSWKQPSIRIAGKLIPIPRLQSWQAEPKSDGSAIVYTYSNMEFASEPFHKDIAALKNLIERTSGYHFNSVLCNLYRTGEDSVSWHADDEPELGKNPVIASFSLGAERTFQIKGKDKNSSKKDIPLEHNSLLIMPPGFQSSFLHQIPKTKRVSSPRINLTFRLIV